MEVGALNRNIDYNFTGKRQIKTRLFFPRKQKRKKNLCHLIHWGIIENCANSFQIYHLD
ncbi:MAG: hypothetical protein ACXAHE_18445 [Roseburia sp. 1XD42-69]